MGWTVTTDPTEFPVTIEQAATQSYAEEDDDKDLLRRLIASATDWVQGFLNRQLVTATIELKLDIFPSVEICLPRSPVQSISSISYIDGAGDSQTLATTVYELEDTGHIHAAVLKPSQVWPATQAGKKNAVTITYVAGYGAASAVPASIQHAILLMVDGAFKVRGDRVTQKVIEDSRAVSLLYPYRVLNL